LRVLVAPDSFKGSADARTVAEAIARGWTGVRPHDDVRIIPMADGGEGTLDAFSIAYPASQWMPATVSGPLNSPVAADWLLLPDGTGVVELAQASGITLLSPLAPLDASTRGFGELIVAALRAGAERLILAIGGSASTDGGVGALSALGARFLDAAGEPIPNGNRGLALLDRVDLSGLLPLPPEGVQVLSDVTNPLLGEFGAARVFGPQKGATAAEVELLEANLERLSTLLRVDPDARGAGAAGGTGFGLLAWGAVIEGGAFSVGEALGVPAAAASVDVIITGEGRFDAQSAAGKVASYLASIAQTVGVRCLLVAGQIDVQTSEFERSISLIELAQSAEEAMANPEHWLVEAGAALARMSVE
jgi:glycerate kinase